MQRPRDPGGIRIKTRLIIALLCAASAATLFAGSEKSANAIIRLLNSRAAGSTRGYEAAATIVRKDAEAGKALQRFLLALISRDEAMAPEAARLGEAKRREFLDSSREKIRRLAEEQGNPLAWYLLSMEHDDRTMLKRAADGGNVQALNAYGTLLLLEAESDPLRTAEDLEKVRSEAYACFKRASDQEDVNGIYNLGVCHMSGYGCKVDEKMAFDCFRTAAEAGHADAINNLGGFFRDGIVVRRNPELSVVWFKKSADLHNEFGIINYSLALLSGQGVGKNEEGAAKLLKYLAEKRGNREGMNLYGICLMRGVGVRKDDKAAVEWFRKSADLGFAMAMDNLAMCYDKGIGVKRDDAKSLEWTMRARAAAGDRKAAEWLKNVEN